MKHLKLISVSLLPAIWIIYFLFESISGRIDNISIVVGNIFLIIMFALVGILTYRLNSKYINGFSTKTVFLFLIAIDQGAKIIIKFFFFDNHFDFIKNFLSFYPIINTNGSWLNARFGTGISFSLLIFINLFALFFILELYRYSTKDSKNFWKDSSFTFILAGALCSLIDKLFYGGSLDFIGIGTLFIADFKDIFINLGLYLFIIMLYSDGYFSSTEDSTISDDFKGIKKFLRFVKYDFLQLFNKNH